MKIFFVFLTTIFLFLNSAQALEIKGQEDLVLTTFTGEKFDLKKMRGKVVMVNFWAQWCPDCLREMIILEELYQEYHPKGLEIIGVSIDPKKQKNIVLQRISKTSYPNSMLVDATVNSFPEVTSLPTTYIFDKNGGLKTKLQSDGKLNKKAFEDLLLPLF
ncbi:MAG: TlpA family protein disulfide reductase [Proteobacteria bacterium]|nr:TlpA family protein disulfide reductase [Pseudomonadota bacterium]